MTPFFEKLLSFLHIRMSAAGLEVSDEVLRLMRFDGKTWQQHAVRMEPGILEAGKIKDRGGFIAALAALKAQSEKKSDSRKHVNVVVSLSSLNIYTQVFNLPIIGAKELDKAVALNVRMLSPIDASQSYSGWEMVGRNDKDLRYEILAAFAEKTAIDEMADALLEAGFVSVAAESRAMSVIRVFREQGANLMPQMSYLIVNIDNSGIDFLVMRNGRLYFEYANRWKDIADDKGEVPVDKFEATLVGSFRQVVNFYGQHWSESVSAVILSSSALEQEAEKLISSNFSIPVVRPSLSAGTNVAPEWFVALGCALRGQASRSGDKEITLLGEGAHETFEKEQLLHFMSFWRILMPVTLGLLILVLGVAEAFLSETKTSVDRQPTATVSAAENSQMSLLVASATAFNRSVAMLASAEAALDPKNPVLTDIEAIAAADNITISTLQYPGGGSLVTLSGLAPSEQQVINFKKDLTSDAKISDLNLPPTNVQQNGDTYSFSVTFTYTP